MKQFPTVELEKLLLNGGIEYIAGIDEAGRGPVAGPVTVAAVIFPASHFENSPAKLVKTVRDSKQIPESQRDSVSAEIKDKVLDFSVAHVSSEIIDSTNILNATRLAVSKAVESLKITPQVILIDGKFLNIKGKTCISIIKGDSTIYSIAAASIIAKTSRDKLMRQYAEEFPSYFFEKNKGYLTAKHLQAIRKYGFTSIHRRSFLSAI
jgi:ribonuclease HII